MGIVVSSPAAGRAAPKHSVAPWFGRSQVKLALASPRHKNAGVLCLRPIQCLKSRSEMGLRGLTWRGLARMSSAAADNGGSGLAACAEVKGRFFRSRAANSSSA
jgi:hypothetical protein